MEAFLYSALFIIIIIGSLGILYVYQYNKLQHSKTKIDHAECLIDEALRSRFDVLNKIDSLICKELDYKNLLKDLDKLKDENISNFDLDRKFTEDLSLVNQFVIQDKNSSEYIKELPIERKVDLIEILLQMLQLNTTKTQF